MFQVAWRDGPTDANGRLYLREFPDASANRRVQVAKSNAWRLPLLRGEDRDYAGRERRQSSEKVCSYSFFSAPWLSPWFALTIQAELFLLPWYRVFFFWGYGHATLDSDWDLKKDSLQAHFLE